MDELIKAKIVSMESGLLNYENIEMIRIKSKRHTLLIMKNFMPVIGELEGSVEFVFKEYTLLFENLKGYYMHKKNEFSLLVEKGNVEPIKMLEDEDE